MESLIIREDEACDSYPVARLFGITDIGARLLASRGVISPADAGRFLYPRLSSFHSPFLIPSMKPAVARIRAAIKAHEKVGIFSDSDIDGLTSLTIVSQFLTSASLETVRRFPVGDETYGLTSGVVDAFASAGVKLIITLDCGIRDVAEIARAREAGMDCIVCDHHEPGEVLPDAIVVDPKVGEGYPFRELAGVSVAMKLCHAVAISYLPMYNRRYAIALADDVTGDLEIRVFENSVRIASLPEAEARESGLPDKIHTLFHYNIAEVPGWLSDSCGALEPFENLVASAGLVVLPGVKETLLRALSLPDDYPASLADLAEEFFFDVSFIRPRKIRKLLSRWLPLAAIGTVADIVPLVGENRTIVEKGLAMIGKCDLPPIKLIHEEFGECDTTTVGWKIAPLLNTPGRLGKTDFTADFLLSAEQEEAALILKWIKKLNDERRRTMKANVDYFTSEIENGSVCGGKNITYVRSDRVGEGFTGLIAGKIADRTGKPTIVVSDCAEKPVVKGSGRAPGGIDFLSFVEPFAERFERFGGHAHAFGFSIRSDIADDIIGKIDDGMDHASLKKRESVADLSVAAPGDLVAFFKRDYSRFAPFGHGNENPLFYTPAIAVGTCSSFGSDSRHGKYVFPGGVTAIGWDLFADMDMYSGKRCDLLYRIEEDRYNGRMRMIIERLEPADDRS